jgi:hypothetical protein
MTDYKKIEQKQLEKSFTRVKKLKEKLESKQFLLQEEINRRLNLVELGRDYVTKSKNLEMP